MTNATIFAFGLPGGMEWILLALVVLLLFGARRIPELMRGLGRGIREFKDATREIKDGIAHEGRDLDRAVREDRPEREAPRKSDSAPRQDREDERKSQADNN